MNEIEIKFLINDPESLIKKIDKLGASYQGEALQRTVVFDTPDEEIYNKGQHLRVRSGFDNTITFKKKLENISGQFKEEEETEVVISDTAKMEKILHELGYVTDRIMEKYRKEWTLDGTTIELDRLPFATYLEIEGEKEDIKKVVNKLGLDLKDGTPATYGGIWKQYKKEHGIDKKDIIFEESDD